ncbi:MAG: hypothetical protein ACQKBU_11535, partial [Verrucomicrobiales bacterium]
MDGSFVGDTEDKRLLSLHPSPRFSRVQLLFDSFPARGFDSASLSPPNALPAMPQIPRETVEQVLSAT